MRVPGSVRVAHSPSHHPFVQAIDPAAVVVDDPWSPDELRDASVGAVHVHFGFEHLSPTELTDRVHRVRSHGVRLVHTVHDVDNPHLTDQRPHHLRTAALVRLADAVTTLTASAADDVERRWGRRPLVIPHPPLAATGPRAATSARRCALLWLGTVRPNLDVDATIEFLSAVDVDVEVVVREDAAERVPGALRRAASASNAHGHRRSFTIRRRPTDAELEDLVASSEVLILPYAWGTHSGLVELATDLGVPCVTTDTGSRGDQGAVVAPRLALADATRRVLADGVVPHRPAAASLDSVRKAHRRLYASLEAAQNTAARSSQ